MAPKIFVTGGTGYIGGSVLHTIVTSHPEYGVSALLRNIPSNFTSTYPNVKVVKGDYESTEILANEAEKADVVVHNGNSDHEPSLNALITGLLRKSRPGFLVHLSGTGIVADYNDSTYLGKLNPKIWNDLTDIPEIASLPDNSLHRNTEKILFDTISKHGDKINIAIMCPPDIYGKGLGLAKTWSALVPIFIDQVKKNGDRVFVYGEGENTRSWVHIRDLMQVYQHVVEAAANGGDGADWNENGYYFAGTQEVSHLQLATKLAQLLKKYGVISNDELVQIDLEMLDNLMPYPRFDRLGRYMFASNSRTKAERAKKFFGYEGKEKGFLESLEEDVAAEVGRK